MCLVLVVALLLAYIRSLQDLGSAANQARTSHQEVSTAAQLNEQAREAEYPRINFTSKYYQSGTVNEVDVDLGRVEGEEVVRYFRFLHNIVVTQKELNGTEWNGGLQAIVRNVDVYLDADVSPRLIMDLARVNDPAFARLTLTDGATAATTRNCMPLIGDKMAYQGCSERILEGVERLFRRMPPESRQHGEVYLMMGKSAGQDNQGLINMKQRASEELDTELIASRAGALAKFYFELKGLPFVHRVQFDTIELNEGSQNDHCLERDGRDSLRYARDRIREINRDVELNLRMVTDCERELIEFAGER